MACTVIGGTMTEHLGGQTTLGIAQSIPVACLRGSLDCSLVGQVERNVTEVRTHARERSERSISVVSHVALAFAVTLRVARTIGIILGFATGAMIGRTVAQNLCREARTSVTEPIVVSRLRSGTHCSRVTAA